MHDSVSRVADSLQHADPVVRLQVALTAGTYPDDEFLEPLVARCAVEPDELKLELGRGELDVQRSLARAYVELGDAGEQIVQSALTDGDLAVRVHAAAIMRLIDDPDATFYLDPHDG